MQCHAWWEFHEHLVATAIQKSLSSQSFFLKFLHIPLESQKNLKEFADVLLMILDQFFLALFSLSVKRDP